MAWDKVFFAVNPLIYFGPDSTDMLLQTRFTRAMVVTDPFMKESGMLDQVLSRPEDGLNKLITAVRMLLKTVGINPAISEQGVERADFETKLTDMCRAALADGCTDTNPVRPTEVDLEDIYLCAYCAS